MRKDNPTMPSLATLRGTKPLTQWERNYLGNKINKHLAANRGPSKPYRFAAGDKVLDIITQVQHTITDAYRENGWNRYATETRFFREKDLIKVQE